MVQELIWEILKIGFVAVGVLYVLEVLRVYGKSDENCQRSLDRDVKRLLIRAGVVLTGVAVTLSRPVLNMLIEASADVGEWALARHN